MSLVRWALGCLLVLASPLARADTTIETFTGGSNVGGWTFFPGDRIETAGGNPGAYLHAPGVFTYGPWPRTSGASVFTGDYRAERIVSIGVDLITIDVALAALGFPLSLMLYSDNETPGDSSDDWAAYTLGPNVPLPGQGWLSYDFSVPSQSAVLPPGWEILALGSSSPPDPDWNDLVTSVSRLAFLYGDPTELLLEQLWDVGLDNARICADDDVAVPGDKMVGATWGIIKALYR